MMHLRKTKENLLQLFHLVVHDRFCFQFELLPFELKGLSFKKKWNLLKTGINRAVFPHIPLGIPVTAQIEPVNYCSLDCSQCLTSKALEYSPRKLLPLEVFESFIDEMGDYLVLIVLWMWGEPFLHPQLLSMVKYAKARNIAVHTSTNGNFILDKKKAREIIWSGLDSIVFAVDGVTEATYNKYRRGGDLTQVVDNIATLVKIRDTQKAKNPLINIRFVVMKHNEHEIEAMKNLARDLGADVLTLKTVEIPLTNGGIAARDLEPLEKRYQKYEYINGSGDVKKFPFRCIRPMKRITMDAHGEILSCEYDYQKKHSFGRFSIGKNVLDILRGEKAAQFRKDFHQGRNAFYLCRDCTNKNMKYKDTIFERFTFS